MQIGVKQSNTVGYHIPNCEQESLAYLSEIFDHNGTRCYFLEYAAGTSTTHRHSIQRQSSPSIAYQVFLGRDPLRSIELVQRNPDGSEVPVGGGIGNTVTGQRFDDVSTDAIRQRAGAVARVVSVQARETTFQAVVEVVAAVADPDRLLRTASPEELLAAVFGETRRYEGFYLELRDEEGRPFLKLVASHEPGEMSRA